LGATAIPVGLSNTAPRRARFTASIGTTIFGAFVAMGLLIAALGGYGLYVLQAAGGFVVELYDRPLMAINYDRAASLDFAEMDKEQLRQAAELAAEFNALLARQEAVSERLRRFTGDAAHELRSPVASIRVQAEVAVANPDAELALETLEDILAEAVRLSSLLDGLLALAQDLLLEDDTLKGAWAARCLSAAVLRLIGGQGADLAFEKRDDVTLAECLDMAGDKTAALMACACSIGAVHLGRNRTRHRRPAIFHAAEHGEAGGRDG